MHKYYGFGLRISSEFEFPEMQPCDFAEPDITIVKGKVPDAPSGEVLLSKPFSTIAVGEYFLTIRNIARYYSGFGKTIIAEPAPGIDEHSVRLFLLGSSMAAILYQRGAIPLHAAGIVRDGRLLLFAGNSGAGKSTLLAKLATLGYAVFTDDVCVVKYDEASGRVVGAASYPMIKLWEDAMTKIDNKAYNREFKIRPRLPKYGQFFYETFQTDWLPVDRIFVLGTQNRTDVSVTKLQPLQAFKRLEKQAYKHQLIADRQMRLAHFSLITRITAATPVFEVMRPVNGSNVDVLAEKIETFF